jgi:hypothetical protein
MFYTNTCSPVNLGTIPSRERAAMIALYVPPSFGGQMKCPTCGEHTRDDWQKLIVKTGFQRVAHETSILIDRNEESGLQAQWLELDWMRCENPECKQVVVRTHKHFVLYSDPNDAEPLMQNVETFYAFPRSGSRPVSQEIPDPFRSDYLEAAGLLEVSPRMSAVLSRKIVHDLIEKYAGIKKFSLNAAVEEFNKDASRPSSIRENLQYLREIADFGAHTQRDKTTEPDDGREDDLILSVSRDDAEWCLDLLDRLFDHLIVTPERDSKLKRVWDEKIKKAERKELS